MCLFLLAPEQFNILYHLEHHKTYGFCLLGEGIFAKYIAIIVVVLLNQFVEFPLLSRHFFGMLKKIGIGILLLLISKCCLLFIDLYGQVVSPNTTCLLLAHNETNADVILPINYQ